MGFRETSAGIAVACAILLAGPLATAGAAEEEEPICVGDSCQPLPPEPEDPTPGTLVPNPGNPPVHVYEPGKKHHKKKHHKRQRGKSKGSKGHGRAGGSAH
ncbi:MAG TPA: hypothetical protein VJQ84_08770 [Solirubrobacterales bacterium]|nr:hypothetical protein [Solirubrobacterales bacterium]